MGRSLRLCRFALLASVLIMGGFYSPSAFATCQASITMTPSGTGGINATLFGQGSCFASGNNGGPVTLLISKNGGEFVGVWNCPDGPCTKEIGEFISCAGHQEWEVKAECYKQIGPNDCAQDASGTQKDSLDLDHSNSLSAGDAAPSIFGVLHAHAPDAWTDRVITYTRLLSDGTKESAGSQGVGSPTLDDVDVNFAVSVPAPGGTLVATLISCGDAYASAVLADNNQCDPCDANLPPECQGCVGRPVQLSNGNMRMSDTDPLPSLSGVPMKRTYDSAGPSSTWFGVGWSSMFDRALYIYPPMIDGDYVMIWLDGTKRYIFRETQGTFVQMWPLGTQHATLTVDGATGAYTLREPARDIEVVMEPQTGLPVTYRSRSTGRTLSISYSGTTPTAVSDSWGNFGWTIASSSNRIDSISVDGTSLTWQYVYTGGTLTAVTGPGDATWRSYTYSGNYLTEAHDGAGNLIESHTYDGFGRAKSSLQSEGDIQNIDYTAPSGSFERVAKVWFASGARTDYHILYVAGRARTVQVDGNCSSCGTNDAVFAYKPADFAQAGGQLLRMQDARGYVTVWTYDSADRVASVTKVYKPSNCDPETDPARCRQTPADLVTLSLAATSATETISYTYADPNWPDRPTTTARASVANPEQQTTQTLTYDAITGAVLTDTTQGYVGTEPETHVTTTALYNGSEGSAFTPGGGFATAWLTLAQPAGLRKSADGPRTDVSDITQWVYYPINVAVPAFWRGRLAAVRDAAGNIVRFESYDALGNATRVVDANGVATEYTYDALGRVLTTTLKGVSGCNTSHDALCATDLVTSRTYQSTFGPLASETRPGGGTITYDYDDRGRLSAMTRDVSASLFERLEYSYDPLTGKKSAERYLSGQPGSWTLARSEGFRYDTFGRLIAVDHPDAESILYTYDAGGNVATVQDENHTTPNTTYKYDPVNRLARVTQTLSTAPGGAIVTQYSYDLHGNLTSVLDPNGNNTTYAFDDFGLMKQQVSPVTGTTTHAYDLAGNLTSTTDANSASTSRTYDALNRITSAVSSKGTVSETVTWAYDGTAPFSRGRLRFMVHPNTSATLYEYERRGFVRSETTPAGGFLYFSYDVDGNRSGIDYLWGLGVTYTHDLAGRPTSAVSGTATWVASAAYLPFGPFTQLVYGNGTTRTMEYDARYRVLRNKLIGPVGVIADYTYANDAVGNITQIHDAVDPTYNRDFGYDDVNRLTTATTGSSLWGSGAYTYDPMGNLLSRTLGTPPVDDGQVLSPPRHRVPKAAAVSGYVDSTLFAYEGTTPKLTTVTSGGLDHTVSYDLAGNETQYYVARTYSPRNLLASVMDDTGEGTAHRVDYHYDGRGIRVVRTESPNIDTPAYRAYVYSPELQLLAITSDSPNVWGSVYASEFFTVLPPDRAFIWFGGQPVAEIGSPRTADIGSLSVLNTRRPRPLYLTDNFYTFTDHLGTPLLQTDTLGQVVWRAEHEPYGNVWKMRAGARTDQPLRFPGQELAMTWEGPEENYNIFRWYRSTWGRYTQADPLEAMVTEHSSLRARRSTYAYADQNPLRFFDGLGLDIGSGATGRYKECLARCAFTFTEAFDGCELERLVYDRTCDVKLARCGVIMPPLAHKGCVKSYKICKANNKIIRERCVDDATRFYTWCVGDCCVAK